MRVYAKIGATEGGLISYIHAFTGEKIINGRVQVESSVIRIGKTGAFFTPEGDKIFIGSKAKQRDLDELMQSIIASIFEGSIDIARVVAHG